MANYRTLKGFDVKVVSSDPSPVVLGQMWYNSEDSKLRVAKNVGSWTEGNNANTARQAPGFCGLQTAALIAGGKVSSANGEDVSEEYDGTSWTEGN